MRRAIQTPWLIGVAAAGVILLTGAITLGAGQEQGPIDFNRARQLYERSRAGQTLTPEEQSYLTRARQAMAKRVKDAPAANAKRGVSHTGLIPLDQMTATETYKGEDGGLYGEGKNVPPTEHWNAAERELAKIRPLGPDGRPAADGKIVLLSMGMSNTTLEFRRFKALADRDPQKAGRLVILDGAQGTRTASEWSGREGRPARLAAQSNLTPWEVLDSRLHETGISHLQIQVLWMKHANRSPDQPFPEHARILEADVKKTLQRKKQRFPNLRIAYLSSRIYGGYATYNLNPEPYAYESAFSVRWLIQAQIAGDAELNYDPAKGEVKSPLLLWGPYLWADGLTPRKSDGLIWKREDFWPSDGTHPSDESGQEKVANLLLAFFQSDPSAKGWFCKPSTSAESK